MSTLEREDIYPTRVGEGMGFIERVCPVVYSKTGAPCDIGAYEERGYSILRGKVPKEYTKTVLSLIEEGNGFFSVNEPSREQKRSLLGLHHSEAVERIAEILSPLAKSILGGDVYIHQSRINLKAPSGTGWSTHSDFETWHAQDGMPRMRAVTFMIPLTENGEDNGPLKVYKGSHMKFYSAPKENMEFSAEDNFSDQKSGVVPTDLAMSTFGGPETVLLNVGDVLAFDCNTLHESSSNESGRPRINLFLIFNSIENTLEAPFSYEKPRPEEMGTRSIGKVY